MGNLSLFLKPDLRRVVLLIVIGILYYFFWFLVTLVTDCEDCKVTDATGTASVLYGYPLPFSSNFSSLISEQYYLLFSTLFFAIDFFIWYLLACEIVLIYDIWKKKIFVSETLQQPSPQPIEQPSEQPSSEPQPQA